MFLFANESDAGRGEVYEFVPYNWGPCSFDIYGDLDHLLAHGLVERVPVPGTNWCKYQRSTRGDVRAQNTATGATPAHVAQIATIRQKVTGMAFGQLLDSIYAAYPEYASKSLFRP